MKLRRFQFDGFKSLAELDVAVPRDLMFLIGTNGAGKSTVLQALAFVRSFAGGRVEEYFSERGWQTFDTRPRINLRPVKSTKGVAGRFLPGRNLRASLHLTCDDADLVWDFTWAYNSGATSSEAIWVRYNDQEIPKRILEYTRAIRTSPPEVGTPLKLEDLRIPGSVLSIIASERLAEGHDAHLLDSLKHWAEGIISLELLSPAAMRRGVRGHPKDIGPRGEKLAGFIAGLPAAKREELVSRVSRFYPLAHVETVKKQAGWIDMRILEKFSNIARISPLHMSDGFMRILAMCAIPEFDEKVSVVLLDEVEDGIEPHILPELIKFISEASTCQFIMTSHSPYLINFFEADQIRFLTRRDDGRTAVANTAEMEIFLNGQDYFGIGEIWANASIEAVTNAVKESSDERTDASSFLSDSSKVSRFMDNQ